MERQGIAAALGAMVGYIPPRYDLPPEADAIETLITLIILAYYPILITFRFIKLAWKSAKLTIDNH